MMIILKIIVCSILFVALYKAILENERMFRFNRFYLLVSLIASVIIPFIPIPQSGNTTMVFITNIATVETQYTSEIQPNTSSPISVEIVLWIIYAIGTAYFLFVFLRNLLQLFTTIRTSQKTVYDDYTLVHLDRKVVPHSFLKYIFISDADTLDKDILNHELSHVRQFHTLDILFIELTKVFFWFNPAVYLYRTSMMLNHEFLADEAVLKNANVRNYQHLLLQNILDRSHTSAITHGFNYSIIKKRLIMMTKKKSQAIVISKILLTVSFSIGIGLLFVERVTAQKMPEKTQETSDSSKVERTGATEEELKKYYALIEKYEDKDGNLSLKGVLEEEKEYMITISRKMKAEQLFSNKKTYIFNNGEMEKMTISSYDFDKWTNNKDYSIYIDTKKISNKALKKYSPEDFNRYSLSSGKREHKYRIDLTTLAEAAKRSENAKKNPSVITVHAISFGKSER